MDQSIASAEFKLRETLRIVENLGPSAAAYDPAKKKLDKKYGGARRPLTFWLGELDAFKPIRDGNEKDVEKLAELLDAVVFDRKMLDKKLSLEMVLYIITVQRKLNRDLLVKYKK